MAGLLIASSAIGQVVTGIEVVAYDHGTGTGTAYRNPASALGLPSSTVPGFGATPAEELNPFIPHWTGGEIVQVGTGGFLTLRLSHYLIVDDTPGVLELGVLENIFLAQGAGLGQNQNPAARVGTDSAVLEVSADGVNFVSLGLQTFDLPGNYWTDAASRGAVGTVQADFGKPFSGVLSDFDGKNWGDTLAVLNGSGGGNWFDVPTSLGITQIGWVRFSGVTTGTLEVDAVFGNNALKGSSTIPEPSALLLVGLASLLFAFRRRKG